MSTVELLRRLTETPGAAGCEERIREVIRESLEGVANFETDNMGNLFCWKKGESDRPRILLPAHMDEVGFMVKFIDEQGFLRFSPLGGWWDQVLLSQEVIVYTCKGEIRGIIGSSPPHLLSQEERKKVVEKKDMFIDVGAKDKAQAEGEFGIRVGDPILPRFPFQRMKNERMLLSKAWDDRLGCALFIEVLKNLGNRTHPNTVIGAGTVQEEVGCRGAMTASERTDPDMAIVMEVGIANDVPGGKGEDMAGALGKGPQILVLDARMIPNLKLRDLAIEVAEACEIPIQLSIMEGGATDGSFIHVHGEGIPTLCIGVPTRYIHSQAGLIHMDDFEAACRLVTEMVMRLDRNTVAGLKPL